MRLFSDEPAVYSELYDALQVLAEAMHADMEERQQRQLHEYQAKVNEIRECCQRSGTSFANIDELEHDEHEHTRA